MYLLDPEARLLYPYLRLIHPDRRLFLAQRRLPGSERDLRRIDGRDAVERIGIGDQVSVAVPLEVRVVPAVGVRERSEIGCADPVRKRDPPIGKDKRLPARAMLIRFTGEQAEQ